MDHAGQPPAHPDYSSPNTQPGNEKIHANRHTNQINRTQPTLTTLRLQRATSPPPPSKTLMSLINKINNYS
jgi:hypothetical protein